MEDLKVMALKGGRFVLALEDLDPKGARVVAGAVGVVLRKAGYYGDGCGPLVRWANGTTCNVYEGQVKPLDGEIEGFRCGE